MSGVEEEKKPDLREQIGAAVNASVLLATASVERAQQNETALLRIAAVGGASRLIAANGDLPRSRDPDDRSHIEARLAPLLWRLKYGGDSTRQTALDAVQLFSTWVAGTFGWQRSPGPALLLRPFAARVIYEWLADRCAACGGSGLQELLHGGMVRRPRRFGDPRVRHIRCRVCNGTRHAGPDTSARADALEISVAEYKAQWVARFKSGRIWLDGIARRLNRPLRSQLERH